MSTLPARPYPFRPLGLYDALVSDGAPAGACSILQNLVHDITTPLVWIGRPAAELISNFANFNSPGDVSVMLAIGTRVFGMIGTQRFAGKDEPFCFDTATNLFSGILNISAAAQLPATQPSTGPWTPPTMAVVGSKIIVTHPGFAGTGNFIGIIDIATITAPTWSAGNTTVQGLPSIPLAVAQFDNRAWYACANRAYYSDALAPDVITNATQFVTLGSTGSNVLAFSGLPISQTQGGVLAALLGFKDEGYWQILPDATVTYALNGPFKPGTRAPRSVVQTPTGVFYVTDAGVRVIGPDGTPSPAPLPGVRSPFASAREISRVAACYNDTVYRVGLQTITNPLSGQIQYCEYWYDFEVNQFTGPHIPLSSSIMVGVDNTFVVATIGQPGKLFRSDAHGNLIPSVLEFGQAMQVRLQSVLLSQDDNMSTKTLVESQIDVGFGSANSTLSAEWLSATDGAVGSATITAVVGTYWNQFNWNEADWSAAQYGLRTYNIDWDQPVVYKSGAFSLYGTLTPNLRIGPARFRTQLTNQQNTQNPP